MDTIGAYQDHCLRTAATLADAGLPGVTRAGFNVASDGTTAHSALLKGTPREERVDACVARVIHAAQQQDAWPGCAGQRQDGADVGVRGDQDAVVGDSEGHHLVVGVPCRAEDPDLGGASCPAEASR